MPIIKEKDKLYNCVDFKNLNNNAMPKDEYPIPMANMLVDLVVGNTILNFIDEDSGYNQIFISEGDVSKTTFGYLGLLRTYEWVVMSFSLKCVGSTYKRAINSIFHDMISQFIKV